MHDIVQVQLREAGEIKVFISNGMKFESGDRVIVEADRGLDYGEIVCPNENVEDISSLEQPLRKVIRKANPWDEEQIAKNREKTKDLLNICENKIREHNLPMKLVGAEYSFDRSKIIFYFTSESRVDFRELVKNLASIFRVRIELKQIGVRDEARMLGGCGPCGRELCCKSFLKDFEPVTIRMAKVQNLPLNPSKISGLCGRLMCCLAYEHECYKECAKGLPKAGKEVDTEFGRGKVITVNPLQRSVTVSLENGIIRDVRADQVKREREKDRNAPAGEKENKGKRDRNTTAGEKENKGKRDRNSRRERKGEGK
ncbi:MAG: stage 0 sporulation family protein [Candidatus Omnitrophica bacterium]|nr:stage 0 sporulation family protein [Candidatus Omnitrophota bacterium]MDD5487643.1 stage 0 sporulation family protein [Candidatus Omnitrophota bacterium]